MEKGIKALLAVVGVEVTTHNGGLKQFNYCFIYKGARHRLGWRMRRWREQEWGSKFPHFFVIKA